MQTVVIKLLEHSAEKVKHSLKEKLIHTVIKAILCWIPRGSPDYDGKLSKVTYWLIEVDKATGRAEKEIGFDALDTPILYAPTDLNLGLWTDSDRVFLEGAHEIQDEQYFNSLWMVLQNQVS